MSLRPKRDTPAGQLWPHAGAHLHAVLPSAEQEAPAWPWVRGSNPS